jgi:hypothetical protein
LGEGGSSVVAAADSQGAESQTGAPLNGAGELLIATIGVTLLAPARSVQPEEHARLLAALDVLNSVFHAYGVTLVELDDTAAVDITFQILLASTSPCGDAASGVLGCTSGPGEITILEGWSWHLGEDAASIGPGQYDFQTVVTHELGHAIGLDHSGDPDSVMYLMLASGDIRRTLTEQDLALVRDGDEASDPEALFASEFSPGVDPVLALFQNVPTLLDDRRRARGRDGAYGDWEQGELWDGIMGAGDKTEKDAATEVHKELVDRLFARTNEATSPHPWDDQAGAEGDNFELQWDLGFLTNPAHRALRWLRRPNREV